MRIEILRKSFFLVIVNVRLEMAGLLKRATLLFVFLKQSFIILLNDCIVFF